MKKIFAVMILTLVGIVGVSAQTATDSQSANEGFIGYSFVRQGIDIDNPTFDLRDDANSHGVNASYTRYLYGTATKAGVIGLTADLGATFAGNGDNLVTGMVGVTLKARNNKTVQPYVRGLAGVGRQNVTMNNIQEFSGTAPVFAAGGGLDFNTKPYSRYKVRVGVDYLNTHFFKEMQHGVRFTTGIVF